MSRVESKAAAPVTESEAERAIAEAAHGLVGPDVASMKPYLPGKPLAEIFAPPAGAEYSLLLMSNATYDLALGPFSGILVVKAIRSPEGVPTAPVSVPESSTGQETCSGLALLL